MLRGLEENRKGQVEAGTALHLRADYTAMHRLMIVCHAASHANKRLVHAAAGQATAMSIEPAERQPASQTAVQGFQARGVTINAFMRRCFVG